MLSIIIGVFIVLESLNIMMLYFMPGSKMGNGIGVFDAWELSKKEESVHQLVKYLVYWVAGTKLIFIALLLVILITGSETTKLWTSGAMIVSILSFYWRLYPIIKSEDKKGRVHPSGYSKTLNFMIAGFIGMFVIGVIISLI